MSAELQILKRGRALIANPDAWTQGVFARDSAGYEVSSVDAEAVCFCSLGATSRATGSGRAQIWAKAAAALVNECLFGNLAEFNDSSTHAAVLAMWDRAIAKLEGTV